MYRSYGSGCSVPFWRETGILEVSFCFDQFFGEFRRYLRVSESSGNFWPSS